MVTERSLDRKQRIFERIRADLDARPDVGPWISAARTLSERLIIGDGAFHYLAEMFTESVVFAASENDPELIRLNDALLEIEDAHGLRDDEYFAPDDTPEEWTAASAEWEKRAREIVAQCFRDAGHGDIATEYLERPKEFQRRADAGYHELWGDDEDDDDLAAPRGPIPDSVFR